MLTLQRSRGGSFIILPREDIPPEMTVKELFSVGPIVITSLDTTVRLGIEAPKDLLILREEIAAKEVQPD